MNNSPKPNQLNQVTLRTEPAHSSAELSSAEDLETRADTLLAAREVHKAARFYERALELGAEPARRASQRWLTWMYLGDFERAWQESDRIGRGREHNAPEQHHVVWDGLPLAGKIVLVRCLHGLGDTLQFIRYIPLLRELCPRVIVKAQPAMLELLQSVEGVDLLLSGWTEDPDPPHESEVEVMELPYILRSTLENLPAKVPYVAPSPRRLEEAMRVLGPRHAPRVGLVWGTSAWDSSRCIELDQMRPLLQHKDLRFFSLQVGTHVAQLRARRDLPIKDLEPYLSDIASTAAILLQMDLVICVDTMIAHLSGALGVPAWVLLKHDSDWRWMVNRTDTPWYPTHRLWRQPQPKDWASPIRQIAEALPTLHG